MGFKDVIDITDINEGSIKELFKREWPKVLDNIADPATDPQAKRKISFEIELVPTKDRGMAFVVTKAKTSLAAIKADQGSVFLELTNQGVVAQTKEPEVQPDLITNISEFKVAKE